MGDRAVAAVIGYPIKHSLSPALFAEFARATEIDLDYRAVDVAPEDLEATLARWRSDPRFVGCNVTMPHKERIRPLLDGCSDAADACAAVNVVRRDGPRLLGDNTDVDGIAAALRMIDFDPAGKRAVIFGAGGAAAAVAAVLGDSSAAEVWIVARRRERAQVIVERATERAPQTAFTALQIDTIDPPPVELYVNATPLGMSGQPWRALLPRNTRSDSVAFDLVYRPAQTPFLQDARRRGLRTIGGFPMLLEQALATFEQWFAIRPQLDLAARSRLEALAA
jgi:shikimate dehydrogenase